MRYRIKLIVNKDIPGIEHMSNKELNDEIIKAWKSVGMGEVIVAAFDILERMQGE